MQHRAKLPPPEKYEILKFPPPSYKYKILKLPPPACLRRSWGMFQRVKWSGLNLWEKHIRWFWCLCFGFIVDNLQTSRLEYGVRGLAMCLCIYGPCSTEVIGLSVLKVYLHSILFTILIFSNNFCHRLKSGDRGWKFSSFGRSAAFFDTFDLFNFRGILFLMKGQMCHNWYYLSIRLEHIAF